MSIIYLAIGGFLYFYLSYRYARLLYFDFNKVVFLPQYGFYRQYHDELRSIPFWVIEIIISLFLLPWNIFGIVAIMVAAMLYTLWEMILDMCRRNRK